MESFPPGFFVLQMDDVLPSWDEILRAAPIATVVLGVAFAGWYARGIDTAKHIASLTDEIKWLRKQLKRRKK